jgi:ribosomal protein S18 acetylase RimI-like enzyme
MKFVTTLTTYATILFVLSAHCSEVTIRLATHNDLEAIHTFTKNCFQKDFKPIVAQTITTEEKVNSFINKLIVRHQGYCENFLTKQSNQEDYSIIIAHQTSGEKETPLIGYCRFFKKNAQALQIGFIGVDELYRKQGIAKKLAFAAMNKFNGITECVFRTFSNYDFINELYSKHDCIKTGTILVDVVTGESPTDSTDPDDLVTLSDWLFTIQK